ncbi:MAG: hypothetical protein AAGF12_37195 [Myxococcota bacterium]
MEEERPPKPAIEAQGPDLEEIAPACRLPRPEQRAALREFQTLRQRFRGRISHAKFELELHGDKAELRQILERIAAQEARCCAALRVDPAPTPTGYRVTISGEGPMVEVVSAFLVAR